MVGSNHTKVEPLYTTVTGKNTSRKAAAEKMGLNL